MTSCMIDAGAQGSATAAVLAKDDADEKIFLADHEVWLAARVAEEIDCERLVATEADATEAAFDSRGGRPWGGLSDMRVRAEGARPTDSGGLS